MKTKPIPTTKPDAKPTRNKTNNQPNNLKPPVPPQENEKPNQKCENQKPEIENVKPDIDKVNKPLKPLAPNVPETNTKKPPKLKTKVVHASDIKLFLANKKRERESKLKTLRGNVEVFVDNSDRKPSTKSDSATLPQPILRNSLVQTTRDNSTLDTAAPDGKQITSAVQGIPDMSGE